MSWIENEAYGGGLIGCLIYYSHQVLGNVIEFGLENGFTRCMILSIMHGRNENQEIRKPAKRLNIESNTK